MMLYTVSYITRINYGAVISEMTLAEGIQKSAASLALTASAVTYGIGQLISGFMGDRLNPKKLIFSGLLLTISMNLLIPFCTSSTQMMCVWGVNGLAQAFMWPPLVKIMSSLFNAEDYKKSCTVVSWGGSLGTIAVYLIAPICIILAGWKSIFFASAAFALIMAILWMRKCPQIESDHKIEKVLQKSTGGFAYKTVFIAGVIMLVIVLQGILRDGVATWMPSYISETFNLSNKIAILTNVVLPIFSILTIQLVSVIYQKAVRNELLLIGIMFVAGFVSAFALYLTTGVSAVATVVFAAILNGCMHGANWLLTAMIPPHFSKYGRISLMSGLLNSCTYIGSAISGTGLALFSENCGWSATLLLWSGIALCGGAICILMFKIWKNFKEN